MMKYKEKIIEVIRDEIQSYQDINAPERIALARLITKIEKLKGDEK